MELLRTARSLVALTALCLLVGCPDSPQTQLEANNPIAEREDDTLVVRWDEAPGKAALPIYAGPSPDQIDRDRPVGQLQNGRAEIKGLAFDTRPYLEIDLPGGAPRPLAERQLPLDGMDNFRDLGGYETGDGRRLRWGRVYRSGALGDLSDEDLDYLHDLGINLVCDFRSPAEREASPDRLPETDPPRVLEAEIYTPGVDPQELGQKILWGDLDDIDLHELLVLGNRAFVTKFSHRYKEMFDAMLEEDGLPAVVHCTAGKDRAGMASALVLLAVGVPEETVMHDFLLTNHYTRDKVQGAMALLWVTSLFKTKPTDVKAVMGVEPRYLQAGLDAMRETHGSVDAYLRDGLGLTDERRARLKELLLEPASDQPE